MLKIGIIGLGDIAMKAYLPVLSRRELDLHLYTRNQEKLDRIGRQYRFQNLHTTFDSLLASGIRAAFVHTSTSIHAEIIQLLLMNDIHVYVDKPITYDYASTARLVQLAASRNLLLMVGFNRRFAPVYQECSKVAEPNMVIMQKNRTALPGDVRTFIFDDFIHVLDTLRYLFPYPVAKYLVHGMKRDELLFHVVVQFIAENGAIAIGIMNRDSGVIEEKLEVFSPEGKRSVINLSSSNVHTGRNETSNGVDDWASTLSKRGFEQIVDAFIYAVETGEAPPLDMEDALLTHHLCEQIVADLNDITY